MRNVLLLALSLSFFPVAWTAAYAQDGAGANNVVGKITRFRGVAFTRIDGSFGVIAEGNTVVKGQRIITSKGSRLEITFNEGSVVTLGETTDFTVKEFEHNKAQDKGNAVFKLLRGAFRAVTKGISQVSKPSFRVSTPIATAGVRGTDFWGGIRFFDDQYHVALLGGKGVFVETDEGTVEITEPGYGVTAKKGAKPTDPIKWGDVKMAEAASSVSWD